MKNDKFDRLLSDIRNEQVDDQVVAEGGRAGLEIGHRGTPRHPTSARTRFEAARIFRR